MKHSFPVSKMRLTLSTCLLLAAGCGSYGGQEERGAGVEPGEEGSTGGANASSGGVNGASGGASSSGGAAASGSSTGTGGGPYVWMPVPDGDAEFPSDMTDLSIWRLELPIADGDGVLTIEWDELQDYESPPFFQLNADESAIVFRAPIDGGSTPGSQYPRSELREMDGANKAAWSAESGVHTMEITQRITQVPVAKPEVVAGQIHDDDDDVIMIRFEQGSDDGLFVEAGGDSQGVLDADYSVGDWFTVKIEATDGEARVSYKKPDGDYGDPVIVSIQCLSESLNPGDYCYFKAGAYTQSNEAQGDSPGAYGEVEISSLVVTHN